AHISSFNESLLPMLGLATHAERSGDHAAHAAAMKASEVFLCRRLFKRRTDGTVISPHMLRPKFPRYWHYDYLGALKAMAEMGLINDPRCADALDARANGAAGRRLGRAGTVLQSLAEHGSQLAVRIHFAGGLGRQRKSARERVGHGRCALRVARSGQDLEKGKSLNLGTSLP